MNVSEGMSPENSLISPTCYEIVPNTQKAYILSSKCFHTSNLYTYFTVHLRKSLRHFGASFSYALVPLETNLINNNLYI